MKSAKIIAGLLVVAAAGGLSLYIYVNGRINSFPEQKQVGNISPSGNDLAAATIKNYISETVPEKAENLGEVMSASSNATIAEEIDPNNLTDLFARQLAKEIVDKNPEGPLTTEDGGSKLNFPGQLDYDSFLKQIEKSGNQTDWRSLVTDSDKLSISADNSKEAVGKYLKSVLEVLTQKVTSDLPFSGTVPDVAAVEKASADFYSKSQTMVGKLKAITVPAKLSNYHGQVLKIVRGKSLAFLKLMNSEKDPLSALVATGWLQDISLEEKKTGENLLALIKENFPNPK